MSAFRAAPIQAGRTTSTSGSALCCGHNRTPDGLCQDDEGLSCKIRYRSAAAAALTPSDCDRGRASAGRPTDRRLQRHAAGCPCPRCRARARRHRGSPARCRGARRPPGITAPYAPAAGIAGLDEEVGEVAGTRDQQVLHRAGRGLADRRRDLSRAAFVDHEAARARTLGGTGDRAEVLRVLHLVEHDDQRICACNRSRAPNVGVGASLRADALVGLRAARALDLLGRPHRDRRPSHGSRAALSVARSHSIASSSPSAQRLAHGVAPVDDARALRARWDRAPRCSGTGEPPPSRRAARPRASARVAAARRDALPGGAGRSPLLEGNQLRALRPVSDLETPRLDPLAQLVGRGEVPSLRACSRSCASR